MTATGTARISLSKAIGWTIAFVLLGTLLSVLIALGYALLAYGGLAAGVEGLRHTTPANVLAQGMAGVVAFGAATWAIGVRGAALTPADLRWRAGDEGRGAGWGLVGGALPAGLALALGALVGGAEWMPDGGTFGDWLGAVGVTSLVLAPAAFAEELMFRGVPLVLLAAVIGRWPAAVLLSAAFALAHLGNPGIGGLALLNIGLAGILLSAAFWAPGGLWTAFGVHLGWNATLAALDAPVSGLPFRIPFLDYDPGGPPWLTGGRFGPEGGLTATLALSLATAALALAVGRSSRQQFRTHKEQA